MLENERKNRTKARALDSKTPAPKNKDTAVRVDADTYEKIRNIMYVYRLESIRDAAILVLERGLKSLKEEVNAKELEEAERLAAKHGRRVL